MAIEKIGWQTFELSGVCYSGELLESKEKKMAERAEARIVEHGIILPEPPTVGGNYVASRTVGHMVYLAGVISTNSNGVITGAVGSHRSIQEGYMAARACALTQLAVLRKHLGSLDLVKSIVSVTGFVNCITGFADTPKVMNGASDLLVEIFGDTGHHVRAAIGVSALPRDATVEIQMVAEI
jgi:enamine deaminase RidA (YjgF/YER057c/UK114 family)